MVYGRGILNEATRVWFPAVSVREGQNGHKGDAAADNLCKSSKGGDV
jgi:hypothetical protein